MDSKLVQMKSAENRTAVLLNVVVRGDDQVGQHARHGDGGQQIAPSVGQARRRSRCRGAVTEQPQTRQHGQHHSGQPPSDPQAALRRALERRSAACGSDGG